MNRQSWGYSTVCRMLVVGALLQGCAHTPPPAPAPAVGITPLTQRQRAFLDTLEQRTFAFFWERSDTLTGLTPDRWPSPSFSSIAAVGFALTAYPIGVERGYVSRADAAERVLRTLRFFWQAPQGSGPTEVSGNHGFFYHFLDMGRGYRYGTVELSTIDTALLIGGALFCQSYFTAPDDREAAIRSYAESLYARVDWHWAQADYPLISHGWTPESGFISYDWSGYNEAMLVYLLALGSPTHPVERNAWDTWTAPYRWGRHYGSLEHVGFGPMFGHQYTHLWIDFRGIQDQYMQSRGIDYFENSRRQTYAQRAYAVANPGEWVGYGADAWGLTSSDGPGDLPLTIRGRPRAFFGYAGRGTSFTEVRDDGTLAPTAVGGSVPFAPEITIPTLIAMRERYGDHLFGTYGFLDAFNPTLTVEAPVSLGRVVPGEGWFDTDYVGIDQGPIVAMLENYRSELVWRVMQRNPHVLQALRRAGFSGGWLARPIVMR
jgi:hypothetical protein